MAKEHKEYTNSISFNNNVKLSIVSPFYKDDPTIWIEYLIKNEFAALTQIVLIDDGTCDEKLTAKICRTIAKWPGPAILLSFSKNQGRAISRNRSIEIARGEYMLFVDADMIPQYDNYLEQYFNIINRKAAAIVFGGFIARAENLNHDNLLHYNLSESGDCRPVSVRKNLGAYSVASNNLLVRREIMDICPFDANFTGWGWEDTEWALRATSLGFGLLHIDNPAIHIGLDSSQMMLNKYREAGANLKLMLDKHPITARFASVRAAQFIGKIPFHKQLRSIAKAVVIDNAKILPISLRRLAIKYWRASWAAEALYSASKN